MTAADIARLDVPLDVLTAQSPTTAAQRWNDLHPVGTPVIAYPGFRPEVVPGGERLVTRTRSKAAVLGGHTAVVWVEGHGACIALTHVDVDHTAADLEAARQRLPLDDPDRHTLDIEEPFARLVIAHPERCSTDQDYPNWTPGRAA